MQRFMTPRLLIAEIADSRFHAWRVFHLPSSVLDTLAMTLCASGGGSWIHLYCPGCRGGKYGFVFWGSRIPFIEQHAFLCLLKLLQALKRRSYTSTGKDLLVTIITQLFGSRTCQGRRGGFSGASSHAAMVLSSCFRVCAADKCEMLTLSVGNN